MKTIIASVIILFLTTVESKACLNFYYSVDNQGHLHHADDFLKPFNKNFNPKLIERKLIQIEQQLREEQDYKLLSDYAVLLLKAGKTKASLAIFSALSNHYPNDYQIAANLGTAYELNGELEKALHFIHRGIELNPDAHEGSEWVHVKILEAKIKTLSDPSYLAQHSVLNLTAEDKKDALIRHQILIQVRERFPFSPGPNKIMSSLLIDLGDCSANTASVEFAKAVYTIAKLYYGADKDLADDKIKEMINLRGEFSDIQPNRRQTEGDNVRLGGMPYKTMLDDNNTANYRINWQSTISDPGELLSMVDFEKIDTTAITAVVEKPIVEDTIDKLEESNMTKMEKDERAPSNSSNAMIYFFLALLAIVSVGLVMYKK